MKNILLSLLVVALGIGVFYFWNRSKTPQKEDLGVNLEQYGNGGELANTANPEKQNGTQNETQNSLPATSTLINKTKNMITVDTNYGKIVFETYNSDAPNTVKNFITLADKGFYNGLTFHRVIKGFMIQGGDPNGNGTGGPGYQFPDELNSSTASYKAGYRKGVVAMANAGPNTNGSQFFIMTADYPLPNNYTIFGKVVSGQDVVDKIASLPTGANDKPLSPVIMSLVTAK
jgi:cyclophilin family peptidyl-prolyl cis-trans isomerase